jgi:DNA-binding Lrp family transcriptional regulator
MTCVILEPYVYARTKPYRILNHIVCGASWYGASLFLINTEIGSENKAVESLRKIEAVKEAYTVYGVYDIVAKVESETMENLRQSTRYKVRKQDNVHSTLTLIVID